MRKTYIYTQEDLNNAVESYRLGEGSITKLAKIHGMSFEHLRRTIHKQGIEVINHQNKLKFDENVFDIIDSEEKAYWLGFLFADGSINYRDNSVELGLQLLDTQHLEKFRLFLKSDLVVKIDSYRCRLVITNKHLKETLASYGCVPRKSLILKYPNNIPQEFERHFIRGYVDGDGCIHNIKRKGVRFGVCLSILGTKEFLESLLYHFNISTKLYKSKKHLNNTFFISFTDTKASAIIEYLYYNNTICLGRKYDKYLKFKNQ